MCILKIIKIVHNFLVKPSYSGFHFINLITLLSEENYQINLILDLTQGWYFHFTDQKETNLIILYMYSWYSADYNYITYNQ
jgi:hypothetical protein